MGQFPIFVINRDQDTDRMASMAAQCAALALGFERMPAVEGANVPAILRSQFFDSNNRPHSNLLPGEIGCYASHLLCCREIVERNLPYAVVLEDDALLIHRFEAVVHSILENLPRDWDIVRMSRESNAPTVEAASLVDGHKLIKYYKIPDLTRGQIWSQRGAQKMLNDAWTVRRRPVDVDLQYRGIHGMKTFGVVPHPVQQGPGWTSTITCQQSRFVQRGKVVGLSLWERWLGVTRCVDELGLINAATCRLKRSLGSRPRNHAKRISLILRRILQH